MQTFEVFIHCRDIETDGPLAKFNIPCVPGEGSEILLPQKEGRDIRLYVNSVKYVLSPGSYVVNIYTRKIGY